MIDAHQHFWQVGKFDYPWMTSNLGVLFRDRWFSQVIDYQTQIRARFGNGSRVAQVSCMDQQIV